MSEQFVATPEEVENAVTKIVLNLSVAYIREGNTELAVETLEWLGNRFENGESK